MAIYTLPFAIVGGTNFANLPTESRLLLQLLFHNSCVTSVASKACNTPGTTALFALPVATWLIHKIPVPGCDPFEERERIPPGIYPGKAVIPIFELMVSKRMVTLLKGICFNNPPSAQP